ncbi:MAG: transposase [Candidatus Electrothrix sp. YB6]
MIFRRGTRLLPFQQMEKRTDLISTHQALHQLLREKEGRNPEPTAAIIDSQSVKASGAGETRGFDGNKKINVRKRHIAAGTSGIPLVVKVHDANLSDGRQAFDVPEALFFCFISIRVLWADAAYRGDLALWLPAAHLCRLEISPTPKGQGLQIVPKRWILERTFEWLQWSRRLGIDYEVYPDTAETMVYLASIKIMLNRLT